MKDVKGFKLNVLKRRSFTTKSGKSQQSLFIPLTFRTGTFPFKFCRDGGLSARTAWLKGQKGSMRERAAQKRKAIPLGT